jgi:ElaB/YqjD/DUF883 family membrane-anchored ribosome-binding protein
MTEHEPMRQGKPGGESASDIAHAARRVADVGREAASRTSQHVRDSVERASEYAQDLSDRASERVAELSGRAGDRIAELTGRPPEAWTRELRHFVERSPVKALAIALGLGYVLGRILRRA